LEDTNYNEDDANDETATTSTTVDDNDNDDIAFDNVLDNNDDGDDNEEEHNDDLKQQCIVLAKAFFARHPTEVMDAAIGFIESIGDNGIVIWMQALCAFFDMSIESGRESSIPEDFNTDNSPSVKFTLDVLDPMAELLNAVKFRCNMRRCCERRGNNCLNARMSEASNIAPLIALVAKYAHSRGNRFILLNIGGTSIARQLFPKVRKLSNGEVSFVNEGGHHFKFYDQFNPGQFLNNEMQTFAITQQLVDIATGLGIDLDIAFRLAKNFTYVSDHRSLNTHQFRLLQDGYNAHRQTKSQSFTDQLKKWRSENALIRKYEMNTCSLDEIKRAEDLIAKRANRKRNRTDAMLETEEQKEEKKATVERKRLEAKAATAERANVKRVDAVSNKRDAALYLKTNKQYAIDYMANNKERIITEAVSDIKKWSADEKNRRYSTDQLPGVRSVGKKWSVQLNFSGQKWGFGTFETIQTANYACHIARGIVGNVSADMKVNILNVELAKMAIDAGLKTLS
jgi:hypothetical protein